MSCRHDLANGNCARCYPSTGKIAPGPEEDYEDNLDGPGAVPKTKSAATIALPATPPLTPIKNINSSEQLSILQDCFNRARYCPPEDMGALQHDIAEALYNLAVCAGLKPKKSNVDHVLDIGECTLSETDMAVLLSEIPPDRTPNRLELAGLLWSAASAQISQIKFLRDHPEQRLRNRNPLALKDHA